MDTSIMKTQFSDAGAWYFIQESADRRVFSFFLDSVPSSTIFLMIYPALCRMVSLSEDLCPYSRYKGRRMGAWNSFFIAGGICPAEFLCYKPGRSTGSIPDYTCSYEHLPIRTRFDPEYRLSETKIYKRIYNRFSGFFEGTEGLWPLKLNSHGLKLFPELLKDPSRGFLRVFGRCNYGFCLSFLHDIRKSCKEVGMDANSKYKVTFRKSWWDILLWLFYKCWQVFGKFMNSYNHVCIWFSCLPAVVT